MNFSLLRSLLPVCALVLAGCQSLPDRVSERFAEMPPVTREFAYPAEEVSDAAQRAFKRVDFVIVRSSPSRVEAVSSIHRSDALGDSRQTVAEIRLVAAAEGKTIVQMWLTQDVASASMGGTHRTPIRDHGFFETYLAVLQQVLAEQGEGGTSREN